MTCHNCLPSTGDLCPRIWLDGSSFDGPGAYGGLGGKERVSFTNFIQDVVKGAVKGNTRYCTQKENPNTWNVNLKF